MSPSPRSSAEAPELSGLAFLSVVLGFGLGGALGYAFSGVAGAFVGALAAATVAVVIYGVGKIREGSRSLSAEAVPNLEGLEPQQALGVMSAMVAGNGSPVGGAFRSELLDALAKIATKSEDAPRWALEAVEELRGKHPRSPAVHAELARLRFRLDQPAEATASVRVAIGFALDGGMSPMASSLFVEFAVHRDDLALPRNHLSRLGKVLAASGDTDGSAWCSRTLNSETPATPTGG